MKTVRSVTLFLIACIASPCCTPLIVPLGLALIAGTPLAIWLSTNIGWVYGGLTLVSVVSLVIGLRWMNQKQVASQPRSVAKSTRRVAADKPLAQGGSK